ncbi:uncharacterized protein [Primulina eburnea]|uniref:uncharacterized protein n=1 Tax=Primulina eburnea TaxID=1245227 RepID=UPI003C6C50BF
MEEIETIIDYDRRLREIANKAFSLGDPISNERLVSKVLLSLPERFDIKICAIDEAKDTTQIALEDLISSLYIFEMNMDMQKKDKGKTIAFQVSNDSYNDLLQLFQEVNESDFCEDSISYITKKFGDYVKRIRDKKKARPPSKLPSLLAPEKLHKFPAQGRFRPSNEDDDLEAGDEEITLESVHKLYEELYADWIKRNKINTTLMKEKIELKNVVAKLEVILTKKDLELCKIEDELQKMTKTLIKFNSSTSKLESILLMGIYDKKGLGFKDNVFEIGESSKSIVFVKGKANSSKQLQSTSSGKSLPPKGQSVAHVSKQRKHKYVCHYCFKPGHIMPYCFKIKEDCMNTKSNRMLRMLPNTCCNTSNCRPSVRQIWAPNVKGHWYFNSGRSHHITGSREHLTDSIEQKGGRVTYKGGAKGRIVEKGNIECRRTTKALQCSSCRIINLNLISISQLCDDNLHVKFDKHTCKVLDETNVCIMTKTRSSDNYYQISEERTCKHAEVSELDLWRQKLEHLNFKTLKNLCKYDAVRGMPNLSSGIRYGCGDCQKDKQTRVSHHVLQDFGTTHLELLHMDLMGPMEVESFRVKEYSFVCVDDFSCFSRERNFT